MGAVTMKGTVEQALRSAADRAVRVLHVACNAAAFQAANPGTDIVKVANDLFPGASLDIRSEGVSLAEQAKKRGESVFAEYLANNIAEAVRPFFPNGVDSKKVVNLLGNSILDQINPQVEDWNAQVRKITIARPSHPLKVLFHAINHAQNAKQKGVWKESGIMSDFQDDTVPAEPIKKTIFIHFDLLLGYDMIGSPEAKLRERGQNFAHPGDLALAEAAQIAKHGIEKSLFRFKGNSYIIRTQQAITRNGMPVSELLSNAFGVYDPLLLDRLSLSTCRRTAMAGSPNPDS